MVSKNSQGTPRYTLSPEGVQTALGQIKFERLDVKALLDDTLDLAYFHPVEDLDNSTPIPSLYAPGDSKLVLVLGENAGGKSFFRRLIRELTFRGRKAGGFDKAIPKGPHPVHEFIALSMEMRTSSGMMSSMVYGMESHHSTGECSSRTVSTGISTVSGRAHPTIVYWDEPDIGMSAGSAAGAGILIRQFVETEWPLVQAVFVTSHSAPLIRQLVPLNPHYIYLGDADGPATLDEWFNDQQDPAPLLPEQLQDRSRARFKMIQHVLKS